MVASPKRLDQRKTALARPAAYTKDRPVLSLERAPYRNKNLTVKQQYISGHEPQMGLDTKTY
jgi:hypothetical protein